MSLYLVDIEFSSKNTHWSQNYLTHLDSRLTAILKNDLNNDFWEKYSQSLIHCHQTQQLLYRVKSVQLQTVHLTQVWQSAACFQQYTNTALQGQSISELLKKYGIIVRTYTKEITETEASVILEGLLKFPHILQFVAQKFLKKEMTLGDPLKSGKNYLPFPWMPTAEKLKLIAHLPLNVSVPIDAICAEIKENIADSFSLIKLNLAARNEVGKQRPWFGRGLIDYRQDSHDLYEYLALEKDWIRLDKNGDVMVQETELAKLMPETLRFVRTLVSEPRVTRLLCIPPGAILPWHSHCQSSVVGPQPYRKMVIQIPIETNPDVIYRVHAIDSIEENSVDLNYRLGEAWIFNSWHMHQVENHGKTPRVALYIEASLTDSLFLSHVQSALSMPIKFSLPL